MAEAPLAKDPLEPSTEQVEQDLAGETEAQKDTPDVPMRPQEKRRLNWTGKTCKPYGTRLVHLFTQAYPIDLAPLTTVGNLVRAR
jgi:hypothetical protein